MRKTLILLFLIWVGGFAYSFGNLPFHNLQERRLLSEAKGEVLEGINALDVLIESLNEEALELGLTENRLQTVTELRLRKEGIKITGPQDPTLYVNVNVVGKAYHISLEIKELLDLIRIKNSCLVVVTYNKGFTGTHGNKPEFIVSSLSILLDIFLNDYYKANPKKK